MVKLDKDEGQRVARDEVLTVLDDVALRDRILSLKARRAARTGPALRPTLRQSGGSRRGLETAGGKHASFRGGGRKGAGGGPEDPGMDVETTRPSQTGRAAHLLPGRPVEAGRGQLAEQQGILERFAVKSPLDGVILTRTVELGEWVNVGVPLYTLVDLDQL